MNKNLYHPYVNQSGKSVHGAAALNHYIFTEKGSLQNYNNEIGEAYISEFVRAHSDIINAGLAQQDQRKMFRVVK